MRVSLGQEICLISLEIGVKEDVLTKQLYLDLIRFMLGWSFNLSVFLEIVSSSREHVCVEKS